MRTSVIFALVAAVVSGGVVHGQDRKEVPEPLRPFRDMIGTWRYKGPCLEDLPGAEKGTDLVIEFSWRWVLDRQAIVEDVRFELKGSEPFSVKSLVGWNVAEKKIVVRSMDSGGGMGHGNVEFGPQGKRSTLTMEGIDGEGKKTVLKVTGTLTDEDTLTWQQLQRSSLEGESPIYTLKRVKPTGKKAAK